MLIWCMFECVCVIPSCNVSVIRNQRSWPISLITCITHAHTRTLHKLSLCIILALPIVCFVCFLFTFCFPLHTYKGTLCDVINVVSFHSQSVFFIRTALTQFHPVPMRFNLRFAAFAPCVRVISFPFCSLFFFF